MSDVEDVEVGDERPRSASPNVDRRAILLPVIQNIVAALGGVELVSETEEEYVLGDSCLGCLRDLKKLWRKDDTDDDRTVARIFWETRVLEKDLVPILLVTAGKGMVEDKCALACADLITAMLWPIDVAEELRELDDEVDGSLDYTTLIHAQRNYKASMLKKGAISALFALAIPPLAKGKRERTLRDNQVINLVLHAFRNLVFIKDPPPNAHTSSEQAEFAYLQSRLIVALEEAHVLEALLTFASNSDDPLFNPWNTVLLEIFYLMYRGVKPGALVLDQQQKSKDDLKNLLETEARNKREERKGSASRHSRFGTTISVKSGESTFVLHRQQAIKADTATVMDLTKKKVNKRIGKEDELGAVAFLSVEALKVLQSTAKSFLIYCFNRFVASILKDIRAERAKITQKDGLRLLFVTKWFIEFFLGMREKEGEQTWKFGMMSELIEQTWVPWVLKRVREAGDEKPKQWTELQCGIDCLTQLLLLIEAMASSEVYAETADILQHKLFYNGEILDLSFEGLRSYKQGSQTIAYLDTAINFAYVLLRILEKWAKMKGTMVVRRKKKAGKKKKAKVVTEEDGIIDVASEDETQERDADAEAAYRDSLTTFEAFEEKIAHPSITQTCLVYLSRFREFDSADRMKRVVGLLHRQAVRVKAEGLFFQVTTLELFNRLLKEEKTLPKDQPYKDLMLLIKFILRKFFKAVSDESFVLVEAFFPKGRGGWKKFSTYDPTGKVGRGSGDDGSDEDYTGKKLKKKGGDDVGSKHGPEVRVKKGHTWSEQLAIAIACLVEDEKESLIDWVKEILMFVIGHRQRIVAEADEFLSNAQDDEDEDDEDDDEKLRKRASRLNMPSEEAQKKFEDHMIPCPDEERAQAVTKNPHLKLMFRLVKFACSDEDADELEWYVPAALLPTDLQMSLDVIEQSLITPFYLDGKKATDMLDGGRKARKGRKAARGTRRRRGGVGADDEENGVVDLDDLEESNKKARAKKEKLKYKSAQFIEDSDAELGDDEEFFRREREQMEKNIAAAAALGEGNEMKSVTMRATGTKKRKKRAADGPAKKFKTYMANDAGQAEVTVASGDSEEDPPPVRRRPRPKVKPRPNAQTASSVVGMSSETNDDHHASSQRSIVEQDSDDDEQIPASKARPRPRPRPKPKQVPQAVQPSSPHPSSPTRASPAVISSSSPGSMAEDDIEGVSADERPPTLQKRRKPVVIDSDEEE